MNPSKPLTPDPRPWRTSLPLALLIAGVALSVSTACITSAVVQSVEARAAADRLAAKREQERAEVVRVLAAALPPAVAGRLAITRNDYAYTITIAGELSPENLAALKEAVRRLYVEFVPIGMSVEILVYRQQPRQLIVQATVNPLDDLREELKAALPAASPRASESTRLGISSSGDQKIIYIHAAGEFSAESVRSFTEAVQRARARFATPPRIIVTMMTESDGTRGGRIVAKFDSDAP